LLTVTVPTISVCIPTYGRDAVLIDTIESLLRLEPTAEEILVVDQSESHDDATGQRLDDWSTTGEIRWIRLPRPSIPVAMNTGLQAARSEVVLFLDDDILPSSCLISAHAASYAEPQVTAVVGQVLQPGQTPTSATIGSRATGLRADLDFPFHTSERTRVANVMAGNLSVHRESALAVGGFDENFQAVAYRFETEFCRRLCRHGGEVQFEPSAGIRHLRAERGGTRHYRNHLTSHRPDHSIGDYYFAFISGKRLEACGYAARRFAGSVCTRFHLRHPWWIPAKLLGEVRGLFGALRLVARGPSLVNCPANPKAERQQANRPIEPVPVTRSRKTAL
jgi:glycosyltransferase involved in cell wall biosynthesis